MSTRWMIPALVGVLAIGVVSMRVAMRRVAEPPVAVPGAVACPADAKKANLEFTLKDTDGRDVKLADYPVLNGVDRQDIEEAYGPLFALSTSFLIARDGWICAKHVGLPSPKASATPSVKGITDMFGAEIRSLL